MFRGLSLASRDVTASDPTTAIGKHVLRYSHFSDADADDPTGPKYGTLVGIQHRW